MKLGYLKSYSEPENSRLSGLKIFYPGTIPFTQQPGGKTDIV